jgi:WD40 repeat protein
MNAILFPARPPQNFIRWSGWRAMWSETHRRIKVMRPSGETPPGGGGHSGGHVSPSMVCNCLSMSADGRYAAYAHLSDIVLIDLSQAGDEAVSCRLLNCGAVVMSVTVCETTEGPVVVVGSVESVQVWSCADGNRLMSYTLPHRSTEDDTIAYDRRFYARGACIFSAVAGEPPVLIVGTSTGTLHVFEVQGARFIYSQALEGHHKAPIADISSSHEREYAAHTLAQVPSLAVADESGVITVWQSAGGSLLPIIQVRAPGESLTSVRMRGNLILAGTLLGKVCVFDAESSALKCNIATHARAVNALALHPIMDWVLSVSEDGFVTAWNLENVGREEIEAITSQHLKDALLCGASFVGDTGKDIAVVQYDVEALVLLVGSSLPIDHRA